jgi:hypothetical protein
MFRRSLGIMNKAGRTIVRDPRKNIPKPLRTASVPNDPAGASAAADSQSMPTTISPNPPPSTTAASSSPPSPPPLPFAPSQQNQESIGSTVASYALAGFGVALGVTLVRVVLGF